MTEVEDALDHANVELQLSLTVDATPDLVGRVRASASSTVRAWTGCDEDFAFTVEVLLSELLTNAVVHTTGATVTAQVALTRGRRLTLSAIDACGKPPQLSFAGEGDEGGRGLMLCEALADEWGWRPLEVGKEVWARLTVPRLSAVTREGEHSGDDGEHGDPGLLHGRAQRVGSPSLPLDVRA